MKTGFLLKRLEVFLLRKQRLTAIVSVAAMFASMLTPFASAYADGTTELYVGADKEFQTISEAVAAAKEINPQSEEDRVTIYVEPGNYEEQVRIDNLKYITIAQDESTTGTVNLYWHYCTGYCAGDCDLDGYYNPKVNWSDDRTWNGYKDGDEKFTKYELGQQLTKGETMSYYDTDGVAHKDVKINTNHLGDFRDQAALYINNGSSDIVIRDLNIINTIPVMVTEGEKNVGVAPQEDRDSDHATQWVLPKRDNLAVCDENTVPDGTQRVKDALAISDDVKKVKALEALTDLTPGESAYLVRSNKYNERGHAIASSGDKITFENVRARGNQDSIYIDTGRLYFKDCNLIGGTDYIYGDATAVFDNCLLGAEGMTNASYGTTITAANHNVKNPYGYLFYNCTLYNMLDNFTNSCFGRPWRQDAQITFYKTKLDDTAEIGAGAAGITDDGWNDMSGNQAKLARFYEYGTYNASGKAVDTSKRLENENGFGSVLDDWQILEFNPRNYFNSSYWESKGEWDPMNFGEEYLTKVDEAIANADVTVPEGEETTVNLPSAPSGIKFKWQSASSNAVVSADGTKLSVIRPAAGESPITTTVTLCAMDESTGMGDKKDVQVVINPTSDTENVFNIPVTINQSTGTDNTYTVTVSKNGALIKQEEIKVNSTVTAANITGIPASADGIDYDVKIVSASDEFTVTNPEDGKTTVKGITGKDAPLNITASKLVDDTVKLNISTTAADGNKTYDLIALAKAAGAEEIENSEQIKVSYDVTVDSKPSKASFIDISSGTPSNANSAVPQRFTAAKINNSWQQIDTVDNSQGFSGSKNGDGQCLNVTGKFDYAGTVHTVSALIDYKAGTVTVDGSNSGSSKTATPYTFKGFPETAVKGILNMGVFSGSKSDAWSISNVNITYKKLISDGGDTEPTTEPTQNPTQNPTTEPTQKPTATPTTKPVMTPVPSGDEIEVNFTDMKEVPVYSAETGRGFTDHSDAIMPEQYIRKTAPVSAISIDADGAKVTESDGSYLNHTADDSYNHGGLVYRMDTGRPGAYHIEVEVTGSSADTWVAPTGMQASRLTGTNNWDNCGLVPRTVSAVWEGSKWSYDFATGEDFIEIEVEPNKLPTKDAPQTVGIKSIKIVPLENNKADGKPTIHILGDSTQKSYSFNETISSWGQTLKNYFDLDKINVVNYSMGGRAMKSNYNEGRFDEVLLRGHEGDYVFIHSAHNDETISNGRFERGASTERDNLEANNANYNVWLNMYVNAIKARGMIPVLVTAMPRTGNGVYSESAIKPNGFNPDSPANMRNKAKEDTKVGLVELYDGAKKYIDSIDSKETAYIYNNYEAGESPAANAANGTNGDGTHYREAASKQWNRIMLQSIYDQANASDDVYADKSIMQSLTGYMKADVQEAAKTKDWSKVFPEMASDVSAVGVVPGAEKQPESNFYYRNNIEKALELGALHKDSNNMFKPNETVTVGEFARGIEKVFGLEENSLTNYTKSYAELNGDVKPTDTPATSEPTKAPATAEPTKTPATEEPTKAPATAEPTDNPSPSITAKVNGSDTEVEVKNIVSGVLAAVAYDERGAVAAVKTADITGGKTVISGIKADKVFAWNSVKEMQPLCNAANTADTAAAASLSDDTYTITVNQTEGGTVTVYNESAFKQETADIKNSTASLQKIADNDFFTLTAPETIKAGSDKNGVFNDNKDVTTEYVETAMTSSITDKFMTYESKEDGVLTMYINFSDKKKITCENTSDGSKVQVYVNNADTAGSGTNISGTAVFNVKSGVTYKLYSQGGTSKVFGIKYESTDYPQSTESLTVNAGDEIRVSASASENYVNGGILINGTKVSDGKEYSFKADGNTSVSAVFESESALVEDTVIASDAALTREAMGAILYDAYQKADKTIMSGYMKQNGGIPLPSDPNYDPNIKYEGSPYMPLTGWGILTDKSKLNSDLYRKVKEAYNLGLIRPETGIGRGSIANGTELEPTAEVTRAKAAKALVFCYILTQPMSNESQMIPDGINHAGETSDIALPNREAPSVPIK